jgi:hypothetical protein
LLGRDTEEVEDFLAPLRDETAGGLAFEFGLVLGDLPVLVGGGEYFEVRVDSGRSSSVLFKLARNSSAWKRAASN